MIKIRPEGIWLGDDQNTVCVPQGTLLQTAMLQKGQVQRGRNFNGFLLPVKQDVSMKRVLYLFSCPEFKDVRSYFITNSGSAFLSVVALDAQTYTKVQNAKNMTDKWSTIDSNGIVILPPMQMHAQPDCGTYSSAVHEMHACGSTFPGKSVKQKIRHQRIPVSVNLALAKRPAVALALIAHAFDGVSFNGAWPATQVGIGILHCVFYTSPASSSVSATSGSSSSSSSTETKEIKNSL